MKLTLTTLPVALVSLAVAPAFAQEQRTGFSVGLGAAASANIYVGDEDTVTPLPILRYQGDGFSIGTDGASVDLFNTRDLRLEGVLLPRFSSLDDPDSPELAGIDRDITGDLGLKMSYGLGEALQFEATLLQEITGEHDGQEIILGLEQGVQIGNLPVAFGAGVSWKSDNLSNYIYGVSASEAIAGRPAYDIGSTLTPYLSVATSYARKLVTV